MYGNNGANAEIWASHIVRRHPALAPYSGMLSASDLAIACMPQIGSDMVLLRFRQLFGY